MKFRRFAGAGLAVATLATAGAAQAQPLPVYVPPYTTENPTNPGQGALEQKTSDVETEGCNSNFGLSLDGTGTISNVDIRFHAKGGGYSGCVKITPAGGSQSVNIAAERFGQGWQWSTRANTGKHNPTQAGSTEWLGTIVSMTQEANGVDVAKNRVPLFQNQELDFVKREAWWEDDFPDDGGYQDEDGFAEGNTWGTDWTSGDEVMSEFTTASRYERVVTVNGIPAYSHQFYMAYEYGPKSIQQFIVPDVTDNDGDLVYDPDRLPRRISVTREGPPTATTYTNMVNSFGFRNDDATGYEYQYFTGPEMVMKTIPVSGDVRVRTFTRILRDLDADPHEGLFRTVSGGDLRQSEANWEPENTGLALMILSTHVGLNNGKAIGLYVPRTEANRRSVVGYDRNANSISYAENRRIQSMFLVVRDGKPGAMQTNLVYRHVLSGLYPRNHNGEPFTEMAYVDVVILFGTPNEIKVAAEAMEASLP